MDDLEQACKSLLDVVLNTKVGAEKVPETEEETQTKYANEIRIWKEREARLLAEIAEYEAAALKSTYENEDDPQEATLQSLINSHQEALKREISKTQRDQLIIDRVIATPVILESLYPDPADPPTSQITPLIKDAMLARDALMPAIVDLNMRLARIQVEIDATRKQSNELRDENRKLWAGLHAKTEDEEEEEDEKELSEKERDQKEKAKLQKLRDAQVMDMNEEVIGNIFQALILESGVNWAQDPDLRAFMLRDRKGI